MIRIALALVVLMFASPMVRSHSWYDPYCCNARDCAPIPSSAVEITDDGYRVTLHAGQHPMVTQTVTHMVPFDEALDSQDGAFHACLYPTQNVMRCFYRPPGLT